MKKESGCGKKEMQKKKEEEGKSIEAEQGWDSVHNVIRLMRTCINGNGCNKLQICTFDIFTMCAQLHCIVCAPLYVPSSTSFPSAAAAVQ